MSAFNYDPVILFDATGMSQEEWEQKRSEAHGIGGSEAAAILGKSKFATNLDIYRRKLGEPEQAPSETTKFMYEMGHRMEPMVAKAFVIRNPEWELVDDKKMYRDSRYPFMTANVDYRLRHKATGEPAVLECKFVTPDSESVWREGAPEYYEIQVRHYLSVLNPGHDPNCRGFVAALWGNNPWQHGVDWEVRRDLDIEEKIISAERAFWECVEAKDPPKLKCGAIDALKAYLDNYVPLPTDPEKIVTGQEAREIIDLASRIETLECQMANANRQTARVRTELEAANAEMIIAAGRYGKIICESDEETVEVTISVRDENVVDIEALRKQYPDVYSACAKVRVPLADLKSASAPAYRSCVKKIPSNKRVIRIRKT